MWSLSLSLSLSLSPGFMEKVIDKFPKAIAEEDDFGWTPLHYAAHFGEEELVKLFWTEILPLLTNRTTKACVLFTFQPRKDMLT